MDGSAASQLAFQVVLESFLHAADRVTVAHIYNHEKTYLPYDQKPDILRKNYEMQTLTMGSQASLWWEEADSKLSTKEHMLVLA